MRFQNTGAAELEKARARWVGLDHRGEIVFRRRIVSAMKCGDLAAQETVSPNHGGLPIGVAEFAVDNQQMVTKRVVLIEVASLCAHLRRRNRRHLLVEHAITKVL